MEKIVRVGEKGQITIPKEAREKWLINAGDNARIVVMPSGVISVRILKKEQPEDRLVNFLNKMPGIDAEKAWKEVEKQREKER